MSKYFLSKRNAAVLGNKINDFYYNQRKKKEKFKRIYKYIRIIRIVRISSYYHLNVRLYIRRPGNYTHSNSVFLSPITTTDNTQTLAKIQRELFKINYSL